MTTGNILVADDDAAMRTVMSQALSRAGYDVSATGRAATLWGWVKAGDGNLVITDAVMPDESAFELVPRIKKLRPELPVIVTSAQHTCMTAIKASERGAYDFLPKPFDLRELVSIVSRAMSEPKNCGKTTLPEYFESMPLAGRSPAMQEIHRSLARLMQLVDMELSSDSDGIGAPTFKARGGASPKVRTNDQPFTPLSSSVERHMSKLFGSYGEGLPPPGLYHRVLRELEQPLISAALAATHGNRIRAAEVLGLNRNTLRKKIRDLDIRSTRSPRQ